ncbi:CYFA0S16e01222g1_1 [Cyberlindnera fabianii]|nr:CYFA0S16e01222g1_1 [Cyberlindnera fabianii]
MVIDCGGWKVRLEMKMDFVMGLRFGSVEEGPKVLIRRPKEMVNEEVASEPKILQEEDEDDMIRIPDEGEKVPIQTDQKKILKYSYKSMRVMGKDVRIEVLKVPKI